MNNPDNAVLEISTKSGSDIGVAHSAFNLKVRLADGVFPLECCYQSSKVFEKGGPFLDILKSTPLTQNAIKGSKNVAT